MSTQIVCELFQSLAEHFATTLLLRTSLKPCTPTNDVKLCNCKELRQELCPTSKLTPAANKCFSF